MASRHSINFGCKTCGLIGCNCPAEGLTVQEAMTYRARPAPRVCPMCHRAACTCPSQATLVERLACANGAEPVNFTNLPRPLSARSLEIVKNEIIYLYYEHDIAAILRVLDQVLA